MNYLTSNKNPAQNSEVLKKFDDPDITATGEPRARIALRKLETLWINTGTLCNIECASCYIDSSPKNDRLVYFPRQEAADLFDEIQRDNLGTQLIGFTGGEPFMNPDMPDMARDALARGFGVLILTNAMQPMQRPPVSQALVQLNQEFGDRLAIRISLDHFSRKLHESERGAGTWEHVIRGIDWLSRNGFHISIAGRTCWHESEEVSRQGYSDLFAQNCYKLDANDNDSLLLLPEMDGNGDVPEITTSCWNILKVNPDTIMCASSRMVVKRKGAKQPSVTPCTLLPYDLDFHMGTNLGEAARVDGGSFDQGQVKLNHQYCSKFCVLGGGSCVSGGDG
jgi:Radical SAM superfamily